LVIAYGPGVQDADDPVLVEPIPKGDHGETRDRFFTRGLHDSEQLGWRSSGQGSPFVYSKTILARVAKGTAFRTSRPAKHQRNHARHLQGGVRCFLKRSQVPSWSGFDI
jgi:hypothetical protein